MQIAVRFFHSSVPVDAEVHRVSVEEGLSAASRISIELVLRDPNLDIAGTLGLPGCVELYALDPNAEPFSRPFHGIVDEARYLGAHGDALHRYEFELAPALSALRYAQRTRIFQNKSVEDIVTQILGDSSVTMSWDAGSYSPMEYTTQWQETDFAFVSRLLEANGIRYAFEHTLEDHCVRFADHQSYEPIAGNAMFRTADIPVADFETLRDAKLVARSGIDTFRHRDWNFLTPEAALEAEAAFSETAVRVWDEYPGRFLEQGNGDKHAIDRLHEFGQRTYQLTANTGCPRVECGRSIQIVRAKPRLLEREYLLTRVVHEWHSPHGAGASSGVSAGYRATIRGIPIEAGFRPSRTTPRPCVDGTEIGVVTGEGGEEIYVDPLGRIKVQFYWDREGTLDQNSSCWIRCQQSNVVRSMALPRVGWEVSIGFENGDPDRPIVLDRHYHADQSPPLELPGNLATSKIRSASSPGGSGYNEISIDDTAGAQLFSAHAQKDLIVTVGHNLTEEVGQNATRTAHGAYQLNVGENEAYTVDASQTVRINGVCNRAIVIDRVTDVGSDTWDVAWGQTIKVNTNRTDTVTEDMRVVAESILEKFGADHEATINGMHTRMTALGPYVECVAGNKTESVGGLKVEHCTSARAENIGLGKLLTAGIVDLKAGENITYTGAEEFNIELLGSYDSKCTGDFVVAGKSVEIDASTSAELTVSGSKISFGTTSVTLKGSKIGGDGLKVIEKGKVNFSA